jgi:hypothetical protein
MSRVVCPIHGTQPGRWVCEHYAALPSDSGPAALYRFELVSRDPAYQQVFRILFCPSCGAIIENAHFPSETDNLDEALALLGAADELARYTVVCAKCVRELLDRSPEPVVIR